MLSWRFQDMMIIKPRINKKRRKKMQKKTRQKDNFQEWDWSLLFKQTKKSWRKRKLKKLNLEWFLCLILITVYSKVLLKFWNSFPKYNELWVISLPPSNKKWLMSTIIQWNKGSFLSKKERSASSKNRFLLLTGECKQIVYF